jgi:hypothetical protein
MSDKLRALSDVELLASKKQFGKQFSLRELLLTIGFAGVFMAWLNEAGTSVTAAFAKSLGPFLCALAVAAYVVRNPKRLAVSFFVVHAITVIAIMFAAIIQEDHLDALIVWDRLFIIDFPLVLFFTRSPLKHVVVDFPSVSAGATHLIVGGASWASFGWLIARNRRPLAKVNDKSAWRIAGLLFAAHGVFAVSILISCGDAIDSVDRYIRLTPLLWVDFFVADWLLLILDRASFPYGFQPITLQQSTLLVAIGGIAWSILSSLVVRALPTSSERRMANRPDCETIR